MIQDTLFSYQQFKFLKWALALAIICSIAYLFHQPAITPNGGTILGYTLGTIAAALIVWLMWLGVRKRQYTNGNSNLRGWVSAHIYLGLSLVVVGTLHTGFQLGWNLHTLAYVLMVLTIASGVWGLSLYLRAPKDMSDALNRQSPQELVQEILQLDRETLKLAKLCTGRLSKGLENSLNQGIFNRRRQVCVGRELQCKTRAFTHLIADELSNRPELTELYRLQIQRMRTLTQLRRYYHLKFWMDIWLSIHVPLSFGLLAALTAHIVAVFFYW